MKKFLIGLAIALAVVITPTAFGMSIKLPDFSDVKVTDWFYRSMQNMQGAGIIKGYSDGTFKPSKNVNRAELVTILDRFAEKIVGKTLPDYPPVCTLNLVAGITVILQDNTGNTISDAKFTLISGTGGGSMLGEIFSENSNKGTYNGIWEGKGNYTFKIEKSGFTSHTESVKIENGGCHPIQQTKTITLIKL